MEASSVDFACHINHRQSWELDHKSYPCPAVGLVLVNHALRSRFYAHVGDGP